MSAELAAALIYGPILLVLGMGSFVMLSLALGLPLMERAHVRSVVKDAPLVLTTREANRRYYCRERDR